MRILAIETSTEFCSVALLDGDAVQTQSVLAGQTHSEILLGMIDRLLLENQCALTDLDSLAFGAGPGSFTGVRIAASVAQGLAYGANIPVVPVCTLEALAEKIQAPFIQAPFIACALDARLDEVYFAAYERNGQDWKAVVEPCLSAIGELALLPDHPWQGVGSGFGIREGQLAQHLHITSVDSSLVPQAAAIARLALRKLEAGGTQIDLATKYDPSLAQPIYLRNKVAMTTTERHARGFK